jgi:hypothetical protein
MCSAFNAAHMTAGHNALRGSGPDQQLAFKNALARVGCPDRRIDRLCITCCSPSQPTHHAGYPARSRLSRKRDGFLVSLAPGHHGPDHSGDLVGERDSRNLGRPPRQQCRKPGPMVGAMDFGVTDDRKRAGHKQAAQIAVTLLAYIAEPVLASTRVLFRHNTDPGREVAARRAKSQGALIRQAQARSALGQSAVSSASSFVSRKPAVASCSTAQSSRFGPQAEAASALRRSDRQIVRRLASPTSTRRVAG